MKKLVFAAVAAFVMTLFITSCTTEAGKCYHVMYTVPGQSEQTDSTGTVTRDSVAPHFEDSYKWMTNAEKSACESAWKSLNYTNIKIEAADQYKTKAACLSTKE